MRRRKDTRNGVLFLSFLWRAVKKQYGLTAIDDVSFYVVMNMLYSDMSNVLGSGDDTESVSRYVQATRDWLNDEDVGKDKLYNYWKYVAK